MRVLTRASLVLIGVLSFGAASGAVDETKREAFIKATAQEHGFDQKTLAALLDKAEFRQDIIDAMTRPAEAMPWHRYRPIFLKEERITEGVAFWKEHADLIGRLSEKYAVAPEIIVAIIGVETFYGRHKGRHRVIDALSTLAFGYPPRSDFFTRELEQYLLLAREEGFDPLAVDGSYAGAMGMPQFISSSYRHYAADGNDDGRRDLFSNPADAIASVANYFNVHKWQPGERVVCRASVSGERYKDMLDSGLDLKRTVGELQAAGVQPECDVDPQRRAKLLALDQPDGQEFWVALDNFYVITRYNRSPLYAMAVHQLSQALNERIKAKS